MHATIRVCGRSGNVQGMAERQIFEVTPPLGLRNKEDAEKLVATLRGVFRPAVATVQELETSVDGAVITVNAGRMDPRSVYETVTTTLRQHVGMEPVVA